MPQATEELSAKFPDDDREALDVLDKNFVVTKGGIIIPRVLNYVATQRENEAIDYLFHEWAYGYDSGK